MLGIRITMGKGSTPEQEQEQKPFPFFANSIKTDTIDLTWIDIGADNYVLESANDAGFTLGLTEEYSGTNTDFELTGLSANTTKYFRLKAQTSGKSDSSYVTDSATTFPFLPVAYYDFRGLDIVTNDYADKYVSDAFGYNFVKSVINTSGPTLTPTSGRGSINWVAQNYTSYPKFNHLTLNQPSTNFVFSGDFEINWQIVFTSTPNSSNLIANSANTGRIRMSSLSVIQFNPGVTVSVTLDTALELNKLYWMTFQRSGTTFTVIIRNPNGTTQTKSTSCVTTSITFDRVFFGSSILNTSALFLMDRVLTSGERLYAQDYLKRPTFVPVANDINTPIKGLTFSPFSGNYLTNPDFPNTVSSSYIREKFFGFGPYQFALTNEKYEDYGDDLLYVFNDSDNTVSNPINLGHESLSTDIHNNGFICIWNNTIVHGEMNAHYDDGPITSIVIKMFGPDMNLASFKKIPLARGVATHNLMHTQYHQVCIINNKIYMTAQEWSGGTGGNSARRTVLFISDDEWSYFTKYQIIEQNDGSEDFYYHNMIFNDQKIMMTVEYQETPTNYHRTVYWLQCDPSISETTFTSLDGSFSKDIAVAGPITETEALANLIMGTAHTASPGPTTSVKQFHGLYNPDTEIVHVVRVNGSNDGLILCEIDINAQTFTEYNIPEVIDGHTINIDSTDAGVNNQPFVYTASGLYYLVCGEVNGGNTKIIRCSSPDGVTWSYVDKLSSDDTKPHIRMMMTKNWYYTDNRCVFASRDQTTFGDLFRYKI